ncbi:MAG: hypothetical protein LAO30_00535 [Acidobacteriia bacterium]|nr:hypothetical protein [Terriglobia bacterium]
MNLQVFFRSAAVSLPKGRFREGETTFDLFLEDVFQRYIAEVRSIDDPEFRSICSEIEHSLGTLDQLAKRIVAAVKHYLDGYPYLAYDEIEKSLALVSLEKLISCLSRSTHVGGFPNDLEFFGECALHPPLYRIRADRSAAATKRKDIFHVPFEKRRHVENQRYSIAGLPCLYLGSSIWICWEELNRPELDRVWVSRFSFAEGVRVLDFQFPPFLAWHLFGVLLNNSNNTEGRSSPKELLDRFDERFIASYILCWPLIAASSIKVEYSEGSFFPQYIVPQILLQWVTKEQKVDGIRYFSTRTSPEDADVWAHSSCVFPARNVSSSGHCSYLRKKFHLTAPFSWELLQFLDINEPYYGLSNAQAVIKMSDDYRAFYSNTGFFMAERKLGVIENRGFCGPVEEN